MSYNVATAYIKNDRKPLVPLDFGEFFPCDELTEYRLEAAWVAKISGGAGCKWYEWISCRHDRNLKPALWAIRYGMSFR